MKSTDLPRGWKVRNRTEKTRVYKNFSRQQFSQDILEHFDYIPNLYEKEPERIAENLTKIIQESLDKQAPIKTIQLTNKIKSSLSEEAREMISARNEAHKTYKNSGRMEDQRNFKNLRNTTNRMISKEFFFKSVKKFNKEDMSTKDKWRAAKSETGQTNHISPKLIIEKDKCYTKYNEIANSMNRQFLTQIRETESKIQMSNTNPLEAYKKSIGHNITKLELKQISMSELRTTISSMRPTTSTAGDYISCQRFSLFLKVDFVTTFFSGPLSKIDFFLTDFFP